MGTRSQELTCRGRAKLASTRRLSQSSSDGPVRLRLRILPLLSVGCCKYLIWCFAMYLLLLLKRYLHLIVLLLLLATCLKRSLMWSWKYGYCSSVSTAQPAPSARSTKVLCLFKGVTAIESQRGNKSQKVHLDVHLDGYIRDDDRWVRNGVLIKNLTPKKFGSPYLDN